MFVMEVCGVQSGVCRTSPAILLAAPPPPMIDIRVLFQQPIKRVRELRVRRLVTLVRGRWIDFVYKGWERLYSEYREQGTDE